MRPLITTLCILLLMADPAAPNPAVPTAPLTAITAETGAYARWTLDTDMTASQVDGQWMTGKFLFSVNTTNTDQTIVDYAIYHLEKTVYRIVMQNSTVHSNCSATQPGVKQWDLIDFPTYVDNKNDETLSEQISLTRTTNLDKQLETLTGYSVVLFADQDNKKPYGCANILAGSHTRLYVNFLETEEASRDVAGVVTFDKFGEEPIEITMDLLGLPTGEDIYYAIQEGVVGDSAQKTTTVFDLSAVQDPIRIQEEDGTPILYKVVQQNSTFIQTGLDKVDATGKSRSLIFTTKGGTVLASVNIYSEWIWDDFYTYPTDHPWAKDIVAYVDQSESVWMDVMFGLWVGFAIGSVLLWLVQKYVCKDRYDKLGITSAATALPTLSRHSTAQDVQMGEVSTRKASIAPGIKQAPMHMTGFSDKTLGTIAFWALHSITVLLFLMYFIVLTGYYYGCDMTGIDALCLYGDWYIFGTGALNGNIFFVLWCCFFVWFAFLLYVKPTLRNFFRLEEQLSLCGFVQVTVPSEDSQVITLYPNLFVVWFRGLKKKFGIEQSSKSIKEILPVESQGGSRYITFHCSRYVFNGSTFCRMSPEVGQTCNQIRQLNHNGLSGEKAAETKLMVGSNSIPFFIDPLRVAITKEFARGFYLYQLLIYSVWVWWSYLFVGLCMLFVVLASAAMSIQITRSNQMTIQQMTSYSTKVKVKRDEKWITIDSHDLVPGDVIVIQDHWVLPCDAVLLDGTAIVDESGLTGESRPVRKSELPATDANYDISGHSKHTLFAGTCTLQAGKGQAEVVARVLQTGTSTSKGELITHILFPQEMVFKYDEELPITLLMLLGYGMFAFVCVNVALSYNAGVVPILTRFLYGIFTISQVLSPLVPIALVVGESVAAKRLLSLGVFCVNPKRIAISGKIRCFCFDKTGTLTKDGLDFIGLRKKSGNAFHTDICTPAEAPSMIHGLATCHAVTSMGNELVGNEVEVNMFQATGWELIETDGEAPKVRTADGKNTLTILKRFEFDHKRMTMSSIYQNSEGEVFVTCKGSAEAVAAVCTTDTMPEDYEQVSKQHAMEGCYVLSISTRSLGHISAEEAVKLDRDDVEAQLTWNGLILFRNELKPDTADAITQLKEGWVRCVMITGDNAQCGCYIAKASGMVPQDSRIILGDLPKGSQSVEWKEMTTTGTSKTYTTDEIYDMDDDETIELAVTGKAFYNLYETNLLQGLMTRIRIFSRMSPEGKVLTIELLIEKGLVLGMCGDGGNDCGALRAAHVGLALSEAEASVVSPFTSKTKSIISVVDLLREGRCALATSFAGYKFLITYGQLFSVVKICSIVLGVVMCQMDFVFIDAIIVMALSYTMTLSKPQEKLQTQRPTSSLLGPVTAFSIIGLQVIHMTFLGIAFGVTINHPDYVKWPAKYSNAGAIWFLSDNWECTVMFSMFSGQFMSSAMVYSQGGHYRAPLWKNRWLCGAFTLGYTLLTLLLLLPDSSFVRVFHITSHRDNRPHADNPIWTAYQNDGGRTSAAMDFGLRFTIWLLMTLGSLCSCAWEKFVIHGYVAEYFQKTKPSDRPVFIH